MKPRDVLLRAVRNELTPRPAWVPFTGVHAGALIGAKAPEYLRSSQLIVEGLLKARELYRPDGLPIVFDLQIEAEVLGCRLSWSDEYPPSVVSHPLEEGASLSDLPEFDPSSGRFRVALEALETLKREIGGEVALYGLVCGPFTLALHLLGTNLFLQVFDKPGYVSAAVAYAANVTRKAAQAYIAAGADVVAVVDPMASQISPEHFEEFLAPSLHQIFAAIREAGRASSLFVCGDASRNLGAMVKTPCDNVSIDENIPLERVRDLTRTTGKSFGGNLRLTTVLLLGDEDDARLDAIRCIDVGGSCGFILAPGCDLPYRTPPENLRACADMVHDAYQREVAKRTIIAKTAATAEPDLPRDYRAEPLVRVDVVTLDSSSCAPCQYMVDAVHRAAKGLSHPVVVKEHRISTREGIAAMARLGVKKIPTICVDGEIAFPSIIPDQKTLAARLEEAIRRKAEGR